MLSHTAIVNLHNSPLYNVLLKCWSNHFRDSSQVPSFTLRVCLCVCVRLRVLVCVCVCERINTVSKGRELLDQVMIVSSLFYSLMLVQCCSTKPAEQDTSFLCIRSAILLSFGGWQYWVFLLLVCVCVCGCVCVNEYMWFLSVRACLCVFVHLCACVSVCLCVCVCVCACLCRCVTCSLL